jgi:hypothetical protein
MQLAIAYANIPLPELRRRGIPEQLIQFIEANRSTLLQALAFRNQLIQRPDPSRGPMQGGQPPFGGPSGHAPEMNNGMILPGSPSATCRIRGRTSCNPMDSQQPQQPQTTWHRATQSGASPSCHGAHHETQERLLP